MVTQRLYCYGSVAAIIGGIIARDAAHDRVQLRPRLVHADTRFHPADSAAPETASAGIGLARIKTERHEDIGLLRRIAHAQRVHIGRQHADHPIPLRAEAKNAANDVRIAAEPAHPQCIAQNHYVGARPAILVRVKAAPQEHTYAQALEEIVVHSHASKNFGFTVLKQDEVPIAVERYALE